MKKVLIILLILVLVIIIAAVCLIGWLSIAEYKPDAVEELDISGTPENQPLQTGRELSVLSWNIGYGGLGAGSDFFMDGGKNVQSADRATVEKYLSGIVDTIDSSGADLILLQEVDVNSSRTYGIDETALLQRGGSVHALNHSCPFVPYPLPPIGRVNAGVYTTTQYQIESAERISLPCPFSWPIRTANLKRCLLATYLPIEGSDKQLVLVNLHLEAYDDGEGKLAQTKQLNEFIQAEYEKGNYVIAGGDFNQIFPGSLEVYPNTHPELWEPTVLTEDMLPEGFRYAYDLSVPSCRLLNQPYDPADEAGTQHYVIDGFILSPNVRLESVETLDLAFANSDHNPVLIRVVLD